MQLRRNTSSDLGVAAAIRTSCFRKQNFHAQQQLSTRRALVAIITLFLYGLRARSERIVCDSTTSSRSQYDLCIIQTPEDVGQNYLDCLLAVDNFNHRAKSNSSASGGVPTISTPTEAGEMCIRPHHFMVATVPEAMEAAICCREMGGDGAVLPSMEEMADAVQDYLKVYGIPAVAGNVYSDYFSNKDLYPYFARTVASEASLRDAMIRVITAIGWRYIGMLQVIGDQYVDRLLEAAVTQIMPAAGLDVMVHAKYEAGNAESAKAAVRTIKDSHVRVIMCVLDTEMAYGVMTEAMALGMVNSDYVWIMVPSGYGLVSDLIQTAADPITMMTAMDGVLEPIPSSAPDPLRWQQYVEGRQGQSMSYLKEAYPEYFAALPEELIPTDDVLQNGLPLVPSPAMIGNANMYDAVTMLALGLSRSSGENQTAKAVMEAIIANPFEGLTGLVTLDDNGDRHASDYMLLNYRVNFSNAAAPLTAVPAVMLSWRPADEDWSFNLLPTSPSTGLMFHGGSPTVPHDNFQCPMGICELCWIMPPGFEFLASLIAVDHVNKRDSSVVPGLSSNLQGIFIRPHMKPENASLLQRHSRECSDFNGKPAAGVMGTSDLSLSFALQQNIATQGISQISPWGSLGDIDSSMASGSMTYVSMLPPSYFLVEAALRTALRFEWRRVAVLEESSTEGFLLGGHVSQLLQARQDISAVTESRFWGLESALAALQSIKDAKAHVIIIVANSHFQAAAQAAQMLGMSGHGYAWLSLAAKPQQLQSQIRGWPAEDRQAVDGWLFVQNDIDNDLPQARDAFHDAARSFNLSYYQQTYHEAFEQLSPSDLSSLDIAGLADMDSLPLSALSAYDSVVAFALALTKAGGVGSDAVYRELISQHFTGLTGEIMMDAKGQRKGRYQTVWNYQHTVSANGTVETSDMFKILQLELHSDEDGSTIGGMERTDVAIQWPGGADSVPRDGFSCGDGLFLNAAFECEQCEPGTFLDMERNMAECRACSEGTFCNSPGCKLCVPCDEDQYQDTQNATTCASCPSGTTTHTRGAVSVKQCDCMSGFYRICRHPGQTCMPCPDLGICDGGAMLPYPSVGAWGDISVVNSSAFLALEKEEQEKGLASHLFVSCDRYKGSCGRECDGAGSVTVGQQCRSDLEQVCEVGYEDRVCATCTSGYFNMLGECRRCPEQKLAVVICGLTAVVIVWFLINKVVANRYESLSLMLSWLQLATMISTFRLNWHPNLKLMFELLTVVNFDVDFFPPDCVMSGGRWGFGPSLIVEITLPIFWMAINGTLYSINWALLKTHSHFLIRLFRMATSEEELAMDLDYRIASSISFLNITYHTTTIKCLSVFLCTPQPDGSAFMNRNPPTPCYHSSHNLYMGLGSVGLLLYSIGLPVLMAHILYRGRTQNLFEKPYFSRRYGWLYLKWEAEWYWWEGVFVARRFLFCLIVVFLAAYPALQAGLAILVLLASMGAQFYSRAFFEVSLDVQDSLQLCSLIGMVIIGQLFHDPEMHDTIEGFSGGLSVALFALMGTSVVAVLLMTLVQITQVEKRNLALRYLKLLSKIYEAHHTASGAGDNGGLSSSDESFTRRGADLHPAFNVGLMYVWVQQVRRRNMKLKKLKKDGDPGPGAVAEAEQQWNGSEVSGTNDQEREGDISAEYPSSNSTFLAKMHMNSHKNSSIRMRMDDAQVANGLLRLNSRYHQVLSQDRDVSTCDNGKIKLASYYSFDKRSSFYRQLVEHVPSLLDYLLTCDSDQQAAARHLFAALERIVEQREETGLVADVILPKERANVVSWLLSAERPDVRLTKQVLGAIWQRVQPPVTRTGSIATASSQAEEHQQSHNKLVELLGRKRIYHIQVDLQFLREFAILPCRRCIGGWDPNDDSNSDDDATDVPDLELGMSIRALVTPGKRGVVRFTEIIQQQLEKSAKRPIPVEHNISSVLDRRALSNLSESVEHSGVSDGSCHHRRRILVEAVNRNEVLETPFLETHGPSVQVPGFTLAESPSS